MIGNVIVMAGVPAIMQAMLDGVTPRLKTGAKMLVETVEAGNLPEGFYAADLTEVAERNKGVSIGSYPAFVDGRFRNSIVLRSKDAAALDAAIAETRALVDRLSRERKTA
jgi:molybdopterin-biosynthesis enzyme MoeA-like protein